MNTLDITAINLKAPYKVRYNNEKIVFKTDTNITYSISFEYYEELLEVKSFWFILSNLSQKSSPLDSKLRDTVICIVEEFFVSIR